MSGVPREIQRWLQSLDLSYAVKNPRRDLANGFLMAEIFSRYYRHDISMHSYANSFSQQRKIANWRCLERLFVKAKVPIARPLIDRVLVAEPGAAVQLLKAVYTFLTKRRAPSPDPVDDADLVPPFARPTASVIIKEAVGHDAAADLTQEQDLAMKTIEAHEQVLRQERLAHPDRFFERVARVPAHVLAPGPGPGAAPSSQFVKQVVVKQIDADRPADVTTTTTIDDEVPSVSAILDGVVEERLQRVVPATELAAVVAARADGAELALAVLADLMDPDRIRAVAQAALRSPAQFWAAGAVLAPLLAGARLPVLVRRGAAQVWAQIGRAMALGDPARARALFVDFGLAPVVDLVRRRAPVAADALRAMLEFGAGTVDGRTDMVQHLHEALGGADPDLFVGVLADVVPTTGAEAFNARSLDLFLYYTMMGVRSASPETRAAALRIGASISCCPEAADSLLHALDLFQACAYDPWAPVQVGLARLLVAVLALGRDLDRIRDLLRTLIANASLATLATMTAILSGSGHTLAHDLLLDIVRSQAKVRQRLIAGDGVVGADRVPESVLCEIRQLDAEVGAL